MIDIHAHILPGVDDGAEDFFDVVRMARIAEDGGVHTIVATPHANIPGAFKNYYDSSYDRLLQRCNEVIAQKDIDVKLLSGMEIFATENLPSLIKDGSVIPINKTKHFLIEFDFGEDPDFARYIIDRVAEIGAVPVIAHAERYMFVQENPDIAVEWNERGFPIQINKSSFLGKFGQRAYNAAYYLTDVGCASVIASDAHSPVFRTPYMYDAYEKLSREYPEEYLDRLFKINPQGIINGEIK